MDKIIDILTPLLLLIAAGFASVRFDLLKREHIDGLGRFVISIGLPLMIFNAFATRSIHEAVQPAYLSAYAAASVCGFVFGWLYSKKSGHPPKLSALNGMAFGMANSGLIGMPLLTMAVGADKAGLFFAMNVLVEMLIVVPATLILLDMAQNSGISVAASFKKAFGNLFKNPIMLGLIFGLLVSLSGIKLPAAVMKTASLLASAASPLALFVIGAGLYGLAVRGRRKEMLKLGLLRTMMFPSLVVGFLLLLNVPRDVLFVGSLFSASAIPSTYGLFGRQHGYTQETSALLLTVTILSLLPVTLVLLMM